MTAIGMVGVRAGDPEFPAIEAFDLRVERGETVVLSAPRGHGLDLIPRLVSGQLRPLAGSVELLGHPLAALAPAALNALRARCAFVPARGFLLSNLSVYDNLALPLRYHGAGEDEVARRVGEVMDGHRLAHLAERRPADLTRAQARWVAMVRAQLTGAEVVVVHEPFEGMDELASDRVERLLVEWAAEEERAVLITTHAVSLDASYGGRLTRVRARVASWVRKDTSVPGAIAR